MTSPGPDPAAGTRDSAHPAGPGDGAEAGWKGEETPGPAAPAARPAGPAEETEPAMTDMSERSEVSTDRDEDIRAADPEEGITSMQNLHAQDTSQAEGDAVPDAPGRLD